MNEGVDTPRVTVVMANLNGAAHIAAAVRSVLRQTERSLELILSDDGSSDNSLQVALAAANHDPRFIVLRTDRGPTGPAAARNRALALARGHWIAIVDNDDVIHPERLERLVAAAERDGADIAADDLLTFYENGERAPHAHLRGRLARAPHWIGAAEYERSNRLLSGRRALGYLKPIIRRSLAPVYDESLRIAEDSDLVLRLLVGGARMRVYPDLGYFYRKHARSVSHRLDVAAIDAMDAAYARLDTGGNPALDREVRAGRQAMADARAFTLLVNALKARDFRGAVAIAARRPGALRLLKDPIAARLPKRRRASAISDAPRVTLVSRQRIVGATNGSSAYLLGLAAALKAAGYAVDYIGVSPRIFGSWAVLRLKPETGAFDRYVVHGGLRVGAFVLARNPAVWLRAALAIARAALNKAGAPVRSTPAAAAQNAPATRADQLYIARQAAADAKAVICDYAFLTPLAPYALSPAAPRLVIMHDLMSARVRDPTKADAYDLNADREFRLLGQADVVVAIQEEEARAVRAALPSARVIVAPHAATVVAEPQPGADDTLLFVGSNTPPNVTGLERFFADVWPLVRASRPTARLIVAGSVNRAPLRFPDGVACLGVVGDLAPLYRDAGVVISPLVSGSGLKIKLIEGMAAGKAIVGTTVTAQGVHHLVQDAIVIEDDARRFADAAARLLGNRSARQELGARALACAHRHFSPAACCDHFVSVVGEFAAASTTAAQDGGSHGGNSLREPASAAQ